MKALFTYFVNLCLLRAQPQQLPDSSALFGVAFLLNVLVGTAVMAGTKLGVFNALAESLFDLILMLGALRIALRLYGHPGRFSQSATAIMGSSTLMNLLVLPLVVGGGQADEGGVMLLLGLLVWSILVLGHILRHTFSITPGQGFAVAALYWFASYYLITALFPIG